MVMDTEQKYSENNSNIFTCHNSSYHDITRHIIY